MSIFVDETGEPAKPWFDGTVNRCAAGARCSEGEAK